MNIYKLPICSYRSIQWATRIDQFVHRRLWYNKWYTIVTRYTFAIVNIQVNIQRCGWYSWLVTQPSSHQLLCVQCVCKCTACLVFIMAAHDVINEVISQPIINTGTRVRGKFLKFYTDHLTFLSARDCIDSRNKPLKYRGSGARTRHLRLCRRVR